MNKKFFAIIISLFVFCSILYNFSASADDIPDLINSSVLMEAGSEYVISAVNADIPVPTGTITKLMTALIAAEAMSEGKFSMDSLLTCSPKASGCGGAVIWLAAGEKISVSELFTSLLAGNANDAAMVLAETISGTEERFVSLMNKRAAELGMLNTVYKNCTGFDAEGQFTTARDTAILCAELVLYEELYPHMTVWRCFVRDGQTEIVNSNDLVKSYEGLLGFKYSSTENSGSGCALAAQREGETYISVVMGYKDKDLCLASAKALLNTAFAGYTITAPPPFDLSDGVSVHHGVLDKVSVVPESLINPVIPKGAEDKLSSVIFLPEWVEAPVNKNQTVGKLAFYRDEELIYQTPLITSDSVEEVSCKYTLKLLLLSLIS